MKKMLGLLLALAMLFTGFAMAETMETGLTQDVVVLFTSDVHCGVDQGFGYAGLAAIRDNFAKMTEENREETIDKTRDQVLEMLKGTIRPELRKNLRHDIRRSRSHPHRNLRPLHAAFSSPSLSYLSPNSSAYIDIWQIDSYLLHLFRLPARP